ncbi:MAG: hypothetical protein HYX52_00825 [Chloroflexi bacterium]|nr:hypothetical protein [Chloroflexota bacterium]
MPGRSDMLQQRAEQRRREDLDIAEMRRLLSQYAGTEYDEAAMETFSKALAEETGALPPPRVVVGAITQVKTADPRRISDAIRAYYRRQRARAAATAAARAEGPPAAEQAAAVAESALATDAGAAVSHSPVADPEPVQVAAADTVEQEVPSEEPPTVESSETDPATAQSTEPLAPETGTPEAAVRDGSDEPTSNAPEPIVAGV